MFEPSEGLWQVWGLILNVISPLLPSCWGFSFALGCGVSLGCCFISSSKEEAKVGFPDSSVGKESTCNAGDPGLIPGLRSAGGRMGYLLQYSWASLVAKLVKNTPAMRET